ncbi:MAG: hypothetical protein ABSA59_09355, partial [Terriglobia bacterium]
MAHTFPFMYAPHEHGRYFCHRVLSVVRSGFLTAPQGGVSAPPAQFGDSGPHPLMLILLDQARADLKVGATPRPRHTRSASLIPPENSTAKYDHVDFRGPSKSNRVERD